MPEITAFVDQVDRRPHGVSPRVPVGLRAVDENWEFKACTIRLRFHGRGFLFSSSLWRVNSNNHHVSVSEAFLPVEINRVVVDAVGAAEGIEMQNDHLAGKSFDRERRGIEPVAGVDQLGGFERRPAECGQVEISAQCLLPERLLGRCENTGDFPKFVSFELRVLLFQRLAGLTVPNSLFEISGCRQRF